MKLNLVGPSCTSYSLAAGAQQSLNCYLESIESAEAKNRYVLRGRPGIHLFKDSTAIDAAAHPVRGLFSCAGPTPGTGRLFVAAGTKFFEVDSTGALVGAVSTIANDTYPVDILPNGNQLFVVSGSTSYISGGGTLSANTLPALSGLVNTAGATVTWATGDTFDIGLLGQSVTIAGTPGYTVTSVTNPKLMTVNPAPGLLLLAAFAGTPVINAGRGAFLDGYFVINRPSSRQYNISGLLDGSSWSQLDFSLKEGYPDNLLAMWAEPPLLYGLGAETLEIYRNTGNASFPIERVDGGFARVGLASIWSPVSIMGKLHMLGGGSYGQVVAVRMEGATPVRISTHAMEEALKGYTFPLQGFAFSYVDRGHWFWVIQFDTGNAWVYDATESARVGEPQWHERAQWDGAALQPYTPRFHTFIPQWGTGKHIIGDFASGKLYELNSDFFDDAGGNIKYVRALPYVYQDKKLIYHHRLDLELETGTAATPPVVTLDWSDDNGQTFGTGAGAGTSLTLGPGVTGTYTTRYYAIGLGSSRGRVYRITIVGQGRIALIDAVLDMTVGAS